MAWGSPAWKDDAHQWAREQLTLLGQRPTGPMTDLSIQAWSAVWRLPTPHGSVVLKQTTPGHRPEVAVHVLCSRLAPDYVDRPLAADVENCRMVLPDGGSTLLDTNPDSLAAAAEMVQDYARLQQATVGQDRDAVAAGMPTWDPSLAADELKQQATMLQSLPRSDIRHITSQQRDQLLRQQHAFEVAAETLATSGIPNCLEHGDLWPGNVLPAARSRRYRFIDFGDTTWTHPFLSLQPLLHYYHQRLPTANHDFSIHDVRFQHLIGGYLQAWDNFAQPTALAAALNAATLIAPLRRSRAAIDNFDHAGIEDAHDLGPTPWQWLTTTQANR